VPVSSRDGETGHGIRVCELRMVSGDQSDTGYGSTDQVELFSYSGQSKGETSVFSRCEDRRLAPVSVLC
jgi:hypothetical protein